jgi:hypothetical protein
MRIPILSQARELLNIARELLVIARAQHSMTDDLVTRSNPLYAHRLMNLLIEDYLQRNLYQSERYASPKRISRHEYQVFSQGGEDGLIDDIFRRIGMTNRHFVEFGVDDGLETNTTSLLIKGWRGAWIEGSPENADAIRRHFAKPIHEGQLYVQCSFVNAENIESLIANGKAPAEMDLLSIDIDSNDYWVWKAIVTYRPRVVVIEYNVIFRPDTEFIRTYDPNAVWDGSSYYGASLKSLEKLGRAKGYSLVGCNFGGTNAFFVRDDLVEDRFSEPFTANTTTNPSASSPGIRSVTGKATEISRQSRHTSVSRRPGITRALDSEDLKHLINRPACNPMPVGDADNAVEPAIFLRCRLKVRGGTHVVLGWVDLLSARDAIQHFLRSVPHAEIRHGDQISIFGLHHQTDVERGRAIRS